MGSDGGKGDGLRNFDEIGSDIARALDISSKDIRTINQQHKRCPGRKQRLMILQTSNELTRLRYQALSENSQFLRQPLHQDTAYTQLAVSTGSD